MSLGGSRYDPTDPVGRLLFSVLAMVAEFERDLISMRTKEGMAVARAKGHLKGKQPKLSMAQRKLLFDVSRSTSDRVPRTPAPPGSVPRNLRLTPPAESIPSAVLIGP